MTNSGRNLEDLLQDESDEVSQELSVILTKKGNVYFVTPELTPKGTEETAKLLAHLIISWAHNIAEKWKDLEGSDLVIPKIKIF